MCRMQTCEFIVTAAYTVGQKTENKPSYVVVVFENFIITMYNEKIVEGYQNRH